MLNDGKIVLVNEICIVIVLSLCIQGTGDDKQSHMPHLVAFLSATRALGMIG